MFRTAPLIAFALICLAQTGRCQVDGPPSNWQPTGPASTAGLQVDANQVQAFCTDNKPTANVPFACFTLKGDIRTRMHSPQNLKGFISASGDTFVVLAQDGQQTFTTEVNRVAISASDQVNCRHVEVDDLPQGPPNGEPGETAYHVRARDVCPGTPMQLDDAP